MSEGQSAVEQEVSSLVEQEGSDNKAPKLSEPEHPIQQKILLENQEYWQNKYLFGSEYFEFVNEIAHYWNTASIVPLQCANKNRDGHLVGFQLERPGMDRAALHAGVTQPLDEIYDLRVQHADHQQKVADAAHEVFKFTAGFYLTILQRASKKG